MSTTDVSTDADQVDDGRWRFLYGDESGTWALVEGPRGMVATPTWGPLRLLGSPTAVVAHVYRGLCERHERGPAQQAVAWLLGVSQQAVSRHVAALAEPELSDDGWTDLVLAWHTPAVADRAMARVRGGQFLADPLGAPPGSAEAARAAAERLPSVGQWPDAAAVA